jgi:hypothetical protein
MDAAGGRMLVVLWMAGCGADPLTATGLAPELPGEPPVEDALEVPTAPPATGEDIADGGVKEHDEGAAASAAPPPPKFDPISVPLGPRETSVKWEGVSRKGEGRTIDFGNGEVGDPSLGRGIDD